MYYIVYGSLTLPLEIRLSEQNKNTALEKAYSILSDKNIVDLDIEILTKDRKNPYIEFDSCKVCWNEVKEE